MKKIFRYLSFLHFHVRLKITTRDRKFWFNRVEICKFTTTKLIVCYLIM